MFLKSLILVFLFCQVQSNPINSNQELRDEIDDLLDRAQNLFTSTENQIFEKVRLLETYISDIVTTEITTKTNALTRLKEDVYELVRMIELILAQAADEGIDISDCTGSSIPYIQKTAENVKITIPQYTEQTADQGVQLMGNDINNITDQLSAVENCLIATEECKLKEDVEQAVCAAELSVQLSRLESTVQKNINNIMTNASAYHLNVVNDLKTIPQSYLDEFFEDKLELIKTIISCANEKLPVPVTTPWLPTSTDTTGTYETSTTPQTTETTWETTWSEPDSTTTRTTWETTTWSESTTGTTWETTPFPPESTTGSTWETTTWPESTTGTTWKTTTWPESTTGTTWETTTWPESTTETSWETTTGTPNWINGL